jgi:hypothetical protein
MADRYPTFRGVGESTRGVSEALGSGKEECAVKRTIFFASWTRCFVFLVGLLLPLAGVLLFGLVAAAQTATPTPGFDFDSDGVADAIDNCSEDVNTAQDDTDVDDCGNLCDADYDNSGVVGFPDLFEFMLAFGTTDPDKCHVEPIPGCIVGLPDFSFFVTKVGGFAYPGPSGTTAGTTACP